MGRNAERVYTEQADIARLEAIVKALDIGDRVSLLLDDGEVVQGAIADRPRMQMFLDPQGREGMNGTVRLDEEAMERPEQAGWRDLWIDRIREVRHHNPP